jgi:hypothetical protein
MSQEEPTIELKAPKDCSAQEFAEFCDIVKTGEQVDPNGLEDRMSGAEVLAFLRSGDEIVGVGALKKQDAGYTAGVFRNAKSTNHPDDFDFELGWVVVPRKHEHNRYSYRVVADLLNYAKGRPLYATSRATRCAMHKALKRHSFRRDGGEWPSELADPPENLFLFVHKGKADSA